jgi:hypothetical protein
MSYFTSLINWWIAMQREQAQISPVLFARQMLIHNLERNAVTFIVWNASNPLVYKLMLHPSTAYYFVVQKDLVARS